MTSYSILIVVALLLVSYAIWTYNRFVDLEQRRRGAWADIDAQLKRRWDLVPALVETVRGYAGHESGTFEAVAAARTLAMSGERTDSAARERGQNEAGLAAALRGVFGLVERYPALRADRNFLELHRGLVEIEDDLQYARRYYNAVVRDLNTLRGRFPSGSIGAIRGFEAAEFFQIENDERAAPKIDLGRRGIEGDKE